jgi:flavin-dependent dehydrogenase
MLDPQWTAAFPTDAGLTFYGCMLTKDRLPAYREDRDRALLDVMTALPDAPPIAESRRVGPILGKIDMPNVHRARASRGMALVGDAAMAIDPLWGVGCGWAFQAAEWLADSVTPALQGHEPLDAGLQRYSRRFRRALAGHARLMDNYASGRRFDPFERALMSTAAADPRAARVLEAFATRNVGPEKLVNPTLVGAMLKTGARSLASRLSPGLSRSAGTRRTRHA